MRFPTDAALKLALILSLSKDDGGRAANVDMTWPSRF
jgi:hypothetical protein